MTATGAARFLRRERLAARRHEIAPQTVAPIAPAREQGRAPRPGMAPDLIQILNGLVAVV